ncbi:MAG: hypothetical protein MJE77_26860 [Proteobacteria bacterium]|nr:hypothetical protein [Pseudomonadota bacterium]
MLNQDLRARIAERLSGRSFSLRADMLGVESIETMLRGLFDDGWLHIEDADLESDDTSVTINGRGTVFRIPRAAISATFHLGDQPALALCASEFPAVWNMSNSFPAMAGGFMDMIGFRHPRLTVDSRAENGLAPHFQTAFGLSPTPPMLDKFVLRGITFEAEVDLKAFNAVAWLIQGDRLEVRGPLEMRGNAARMWLRSDTLSPVEMGGFSLPFELQFISLFEPGEDLGAGQSGQGQAAAPSGQGRAASSSATSATKARGFARLAATATFGRGDSGVELPLAAMVDHPRLAELTLEVGGDDPSQMAFGAMSRAIGADQFMKRLGDSFPSLDDVVIERVAITGSSPEKTITRFQIDVALDATIDVIADFLSMSGFVVRFTLVEPGTSRSKLYVATKFNAELFGTGFSGHMTMPRMWFNAQLAQGESIDLAKLVETVLPELKGPDLACTSFRVYGDLKGTSLSMFTEIEGDWAIPIGISDLTVQRMGVQLSRDSTAGNVKTTGAVYGHIAIGDVELLASWRVPGGLFLKGSIEELNLARVVGQLCGKNAFQGMPIAPDILDVTLKDAVVTADFSSRTFSLAAGADKLGRAELFIQKPQDAGWGMGLGLSMPGDFRFSSLSKSLSVLDGFDISNAYMVISTFAARELTLPGQPRDQVTRTQRGVNFYLPIVLEGKGALAPLRNVLGDDGASLTLRGALSEQGGLLEAAMAGFEVASGVVFESAGFRMAFEKDGDASFSIFGRVAVDLRDQLLFTGELLVQPNGATLSATMQGTWNRPFGIAGVVLAEVALQLGLSAQGLPTVGLAGAAKIGNFEGSLAILINSVDPAESVLSLQFNELSLSVLLDSLISPQARKSAPNWLTGLLDSGYRDVDVYICPESTYIGQNYYPQGFRFKAKTDIFGWDAEVEAELSYTSGIRFYGACEPLRLGQINSDKYAFELTAADIDLFADKENTAAGPLNPYGDGGAQPAEKAETALAATPAGDGPAVTKRAPGDRPRLTLCGLTFSGKKSSASAESVTCKAGQPTTIELWINAAKPRTAAKKPARPRATSKAGAKTGTGTGKKTTGEVRRKTSIKAGKKATGAARSAGRKKAASAKTTERKGRARAPQKSTKTVRRKTAAPLTRRAPAAQTDLPLVEIGQNSDRDARDGRIRLFFSGTELVWQHGSVKKGRISAEFGAHYGRWTHIAVVSQGRGGRFQAIYIDGELAASAERADGPQGDVRGLLLGGKAGAGFRGRMAEVRIWSRERRSKECKSGRFQLLRGGENDLEGYFPLAGPAREESQKTANGQKSDIGGPLLAQAAELSPSAEVAPGDPAYALLLGGVELAGQGDRPTAATTSSLSCAGDLTVEAWIKRASDSGQRQAIVCKDAAGDFSLELDENGIVSFAHGNGTVEEVSAPAAGRVPRAVWHHLAACRRARSKSIEFFVDGSSVGKARYKRAVKSTQTAVVVGARQDNALPFGGLVDEVRVWGRACSADEIRRRSRRGLTGREADLLAYWQFDEGEGKTARDRSPNGHDLTLGKARWAKSINHAPDLDSRAARRSEQANTKTAIVNRPSGARQSALGGPQLRINLSVFESPSFYMSCRVGLLGFFEEQILAEADKTGLKLALSRTSAGTSMALSCQVGNRGLRADGSLSFALNMDVRLVVPGSKTSLGRIKLRTSLDGSVDLDITARLFRLDIKGSFQWQGKTMRVPTVVFSVPFSGVAEIIKEVTDEIENHAYKIFEDIVGGLDTFGDAVEKGWVETGKAIGQGAAELGDALQAAYKNVDADRAVKIFKKAGHSPEDTCQALKDSFTAGADDVARAMKTAAIPVDRIGKGLHKVYTTNPAEAARILGGAGFDASETGKALQNAFKAKADVAGNALKAAGFEPDHAVKALRGVFRMSSKGAATFLQKSWGKDEKAVRSIMKSAGFSSKDIDSAVKSVYKTVAKTAAKESKKAAKSVSKGTKKATKAVKGIGKKKKKRRK